MNKLKAVFIDIDGTLANSERKITNETKTSITNLKNKGIYVVLCSGRSNKDVCTYSKDANTSEYAISSNGAQIYNYVTNESLNKETILYKIVMSAWNFCENEQIEIVFNSNETQYGNNIFFSNIYSNRKVIKNSNALKKEDIYQIIVNTDTYEKMKRFEDFIKTNSEVKIANCSKQYRNKEKLSEEPYYMFINSINADKGNAINKFLNKFNIKMEETMCFGNRNNDISMFNNCKRKVAMKNSDEGLKKIASYITEYTNDEDGVAKFINKFLI